MIADADVENVGQGRVGVPEGSYGTCEVLLVRAKELRHPCGGLQAYATLPRGSLSS